MPGCHTDLDSCRAGSTVHVVGAGGNGLDIFLLNHKKTKTETNNHNPAMQLSSETDISSKEIPHVTIKS